MGETLVGISNLVLNYEINSPAWHATNNLSGEQALSKALVASRLCQAMADEAADDDLDVEIYEELSSFGKEFEELCKCDRAFLSE